MKNEILQIAYSLEQGAINENEAQNLLWGLFGTIPLLPFKIKSVNVVNTGLDDGEIKSIEWINEKRIMLTNSVECVCDDGMGGTCVSLINEFDWSFTEKDIYSDAYVIIELNQ